MSRLKRKRKRLPSEGAYKRFNQLKLNSATPESASQSEGNQILDKDRFSQHSDAGNEAEDMFESAKSVIAPMLEGVGKVISPAIRHAEGVGLQFPNQPMIRFEPPNVVLP